MSRDVASKNLEEKGWNGHRVKAKSKYGCACRKRGYVKVSMSLDPMRTYLTAEHLSAKRRRAGRS